MVLFCADRIAIGTQLTSYVVTSGSNYRSMSNSYGSSSTLQMGQNDVPGGSNRFERGYAVFDLRSLPANANISQVRLRFDCTWVDTTDPLGDMFYAEIGPLTVNKATWDSSTSQDRWRTSYSNYSGFYKKQLFSTNTYNDVYLYLDSTARSRIESKAGDYVVFHFRLATQYESGVTDGWNGDAYHDSSVVPDWARIDYGWDIFDVENTIDDDWLAVFSDLRLYIEYTVPILPELSNPTMNTFNGNPETDFYYFVNYYHAGGEAPSIKQVYIDNDSGHNMSLVSGSSSNGTYRYGPKNLSPGDHTCFFYYIDQSGHKVFSPSSGKWTMPFVGPYKATNPSPSNGATNQSINTDVSWSNGGGATSYDVYFGTDPTPDSGEYKGNRTSTSYNPGTLAYSTTYYWRIDANKAGYDTTTGNIWHFTTKAPAGSLRVTLSPSGAVSAGAQWNVDGGGWQNSGATVTGLSIGSHTVNYKSITGWNAPPSESVTINNDQTTSISRNYLQLTGSLQVTLGPSGAVSAGAQWNVDAGGWQNSGATVTGLSLGYHTVNYKSITGWNAPPSESVGINNGQTTSISRNYTQQTPGSLQFKSSTYTVAENGGSIRIYVIRTGGSSGSASVNYSTANGTAEAGSDYTANSGTLSWSDGDAADKYFDVAITDDSTPEKNETFMLNLSGEIGASMGTPSTATVIIYDNDGLLCDFCGPPGSEQPDGYVDYWDLLYFSQRWHTDPSDTNWDPRCDMSGPNGDPDGYIDYWDLLAFAQQWHKGEPP